MLSYTDIGTNSISLDRNSPPTKVTNVCSQAKLSPIVRSEFNSTSETHKVISRKACLFPTDYLTHSIEPVIPIS